MLVLNAGIFPAGVRIEALDTAAWQKVMRINLDSNLVILLRIAAPAQRGAPLRAGAGECLQERAGPGAGAAA